MAKPTVNIFVGDMVNIPVGVLRDLAKDYELSIRIEGTFHYCVASMTEIKAALAPIEPKFLLACGPTLEEIRIMTEEFGRDKDAYAVKVSHER